MDRTTLTANLKPLQRRGLVKIAVDRNDKRSRLLVLTVAGKSLAQEGAARSGARRMARSTAHFPGTNSTSFAPVFSPFH